MLPRTVYLAAFCIGATGSFFLPERGSWWLWGVLLACFISAGCFLPFPRYRKAACTFAFLVFGTLYALCRTEAALTRQVPVSAERPVSETVQLHITGLPEPDAQGRARFIAEAVRANGQTFRLLVQDYQTREWRVGETWQVSARLRAAVGTRNPVGFDREAWALANQIDGMATLGKERTPLPKTPPLFNINRLREHIIRTWQTNAAQYPQGTGLMTALAVGNRSGLSPEMWAALRPLGLNHLISISGLHIGMVAVLAGWLCRFLVGFSPVMPARPRVWIGLVSWLAACVYTGLAGWEIPALRSLMMLTVLGAAWMVRGYVGGWQTWWAACTAVLLYQPASVLAVGFWLSFGLVGVLLWALACRLPAKTVTRRQYYAHGLKQAVRGQWAATLVGSLATLHLFGAMPPFSPLVNAVAIPLFSWLLVPLALAASALPLPALQQAAAYIGEHIAQILLTLGAQLPEYHLAHAPAPLFALALVAALILLLPRGTRLKPLACCIIAAWAAYTPAPNAPLRVHVWDVGQGLSVLLQTRTQNILFDTGNQAAQTVLPNLHALGIRQIDTLILSHHDNDHDGSYPELARQLPIRTLLAGQPQYYPNARHCSGGTHWQADGVWFEFLTPPKQPAQSDNQQSCILRVIAGEHALLIMGDSGNPEEMQLIERYGNKLHSQILVLGHHGSKSASSSLFLQYVAPHTAIASSGLGNRFRHPHPDTQQRLQRQNIRLLRTDTQGSLHLFLGNEALQIRPIERTAWWQRKPILPEDE